MTQEIIKKEIESIKKVTKKIVESKETAIRFLAEAGIKKADPETKKDTPK